MHKNLHGYVEYKHFCPDREAAKARQNTIIPTANIDPAILLPAHASLRYVYPEIPF
jgi:hypothetical protein